MFHSNFINILKMLGKESTNYSENSFSDFFFFKKNVLFPEMEDGVGELVLKSVLFILNYMLMI